jgi:hypothetical protein
MRSLRHLVLFVLMGLVASAWGQLQTGFVQLSSYPTAIVADGHSTLTITATISSANGTPVPDGTQILFQTDLGSFRDTVVTTKAGYAHAVLIAGTIAGTANITVKALGLPISPQSMAIDMVTSRAMLSSSKEFIEIVSPTYLRYDPQDKLITAEGSAKGVFVRYRETEIHADSVQLSIPNYQLKAKHAEVVMGKSRRVYQELNLTLNTHKGFGITSITSEHVDSIQATGDSFGFNTHPVDVSSYVNVVGSKVSPATTTSAPNQFKFADIDEADQPAMINARKAVVFPSKEIQFQKAELVLNGNKVMKMQLFKAPLNGVSPIFTDQMVNVNNNQLALSYPYYLSLAPGETTLLRFHMGDHSNYFGNSNGPQMDFELDWNRGDDMTGGLLLGGLGTQGWGIGFNQSMRLDDRTFASAQIQIPAFRSIYGATNFTHQFPGFTTALSSDITKTVTGPQQTTIANSFNADVDPIKLGKAPFHLTYGATAIQQWTNLPTAGSASQEGYGIDLHLTMDPKRLDRATTLTFSSLATDLQGRNVTKGIALGATVALNRQLSREASVYVTYNWSQDAFTDQVLGGQQVSAEFNFNKGHLYLNGGGSRSIGFDRSDYNAAVSYRFSSLWRFGYAYTYDRYEGTTFLDFDPAIYYRVGQREFGIIWSHATKRFGIQVLGATVY